MSEGGIQLHLSFAGECAVAFGTSRREPREGAVRLVEYAPFPRACRSQRWRVGFTRDLSASGMCLCVDRGVSVGTLLRVVVRRVDGRPAYDSVARVTWADEHETGEIRLGLALVASRERPLHRVLRSTRERAA